MARLDGKVAIVTGAGSGIGRACLELFAAEGAKVVGASRTVSKVEEAVAAVRAKGGQAIAVKADLTQEEDVDNVVKAALAEYGKIDIMGPARRDRHCVPPRQNARGRRHCWSPDKAQCRQNCPAAG